MKETLASIHFELPKEVLRAMRENEASHAKFEAVKSERRLTEVSVVYAPKHPELLHVLSGNALEEGYRRMGRINLGMAEMGLGGDMCCLEDYEDTLRDDANDTDY